VAPTATVTEQRYGIITQTGMYHSCHIYALTELTSTDSSPICHSNSNNIIHHNLGLDECHISSYYDSDCYFGFYIRNYISRRSAG
jgi:hypothetical protein